MINLLVIDDEKEVGTFLSHLFSMKGYKVEVVNSSSEFFQLDLSRQSFQIAMIDLRLPDCDGLSLLQHLKKHQPHCKALIMTGYSTVKTAVEAIKLGASDYIEKPFDDINLLETQVEQLLSTSVPSSQAFIQSLANEAGLVVGKNHAMNKLIDATFKVSQKNVNVLIEGETGTGKEVLSRFIHLASPRSHESFIGVNCGAISESLLESELFGHEKGAFTGATQQRKGLFEIASNGTLFLDEIADASQAIQVKLLRVLETREFMRVGSVQTLRTNARVVAASNENLQQAVLQKKFREDLFYRLNVVHLEIPPLRDRKEDIPLLVNHLIQRNGYTSVNFTDGAYEKLQNYDWPGNIRELANVVTRTLTLTDDENTEITADEIILSAVAAPLKGKSSSEQTISIPKDPLEQWRETLVKEFEQSDKINLDDILLQVKQLESLIGRELVLQALQKTYGNRTEAARCLQISMRKLRYILNEKTNTTHT
ncbi:sigma-54-dependent Fis family transcriptional regulator [Peribacillus cavernae]|uniref:Sigma-54-dependent Fis family transcriptional regulator n=1 Tax=Peribacillus cavernae TaxID=1674310 RepID=A0A3S0VLT3_9BACI|nr:sigma-54 dependent transcriptional regulator [Peribacillus cavernae]MDQ0218328.1 two-component system NtrC family response regulator [Peribacillus cavernae]RUQ28392.1 sigma-54-dependent Fis family transcriptional regulator [Peribacillus cavernae]